MNMDETVRQGGCRCGSVRYEVRGEPMRVGICHCTDCRKETGSAFLAYADWPSRCFTMSGEYKTYEGRSFCPNCGTRLFHLNQHHTEICVGSLDEAPTGLTPTREGWINRREHWLPALAHVSQWQEDPAPDA
jgi:hypothetical protein